MNYVKHLSIALLVLGTASVYAVDPVKKVVGWATPGGTELVADAAGTKWSHPEMIKKGKRANQKVGGPFAAPYLTDNAGTRLQDKGEDIVLTPVYEKEGIIETIKTYYKDYLGEKGTLKSRTAILAPTALVLGAIAYKTIPAFKDAADNGLASTQDFLNDVKDGNGNARRNAGIATGVAIAGGLAAFYYKYEHFPFMKKA